VTSVPDNPERRTPPTWKIAVWAALALVVVPVFGPRFVAMFHPPPGYFMDFSQEWLSARNYFTGSPVYSPQIDAMKRHTGQVPKNPEDMLPWNAHPPASVLLGLPFGQVTDYATAHYYWNLATYPLFLAGLAVVAFSLGTPVRWWAVFPAVVLILVSGPVFVHLGLGQLNFVLLPLLAVAWAADRRGHQVLAGAALGLAAGLKLFPAFLFLYFLFGRRWTALAAGVVAVVLTNAVAWAVFGTDAFTTYVREVMPSLMNYRSSWRNVSLTGFWYRLYDPQPHEKIVPLMVLPKVAPVAALASQLVVTAVVAWFAWRSRTPIGRDRAFAVAVFGMLLASPIAWTHYFVLLAVPVGILWAHLPRGWPRWAFWPLIVPLWLPENFFALLAVGAEQARLMINRRHAPIDATTNLVALSAFTYVLLALFALATFVKGEAPGPLPEPPEEPDSDLPVDVRRVDRRLFGHIGDD
jgi:hypothetical protein